MPLLLNVPTERIELSTPGEWVEVKTRLSKGDETRIQAAAFSVQARMEAIRERPDLDLSLDYEATVWAGLEVGLTAWSFPEPLTPSNIRGLSSEDYDIITVRVNELWAPRSPEAGKALNANGATTSSARVESQPSSSMSP